MNSKTTSCSNSKTKMFTRRTFISEKVTIPNSKYLTIWTSSVNLSTIEQIIKKLNPLVSTVRTKSFNSKEISI